MKPYFLTAIVVISAATTAYAVSNANDATEFEVEFATHLDVGMAEQDVMIKQSPDANVVFRVTPETSDMSLPLYAASEAIAHNPFDAAANGPHPKGDPLGVTLGDWLSATGSAQYVETDGVGRLTAEFDGLVPGGVYTVWHFFMSAEGTAPFIGTYDLPLGKTDGSQSVFIADDNGRATIDQTIEPGLQLSGKQLAAGLAVAWHSDGQTYGVLPGEFGYKTHVQLFAGLPADE